MPLRIPESALDDWLAELKPYQRNTLRQFLQSCDPEKAAEKWLSTTGPQNIAHFGGPHNTEPFWNRFSEEFKRFICDDTAYLKEKQTLNAERPIAKALFISTISAAIGACLGYSATLLAPSITILLYTVGKVGWTAYCRVSEDSSHDQTATPTPQ